MLFKVQIELFLFLYVCPNKIVENVYPSAILFCVANPACQTDGPDLAALTIDNGVKHCYLKNQMNMEQLRTRLNQTQANISLKNSN